MNTLIIEEIKFKKTESVIQTSTVYCKPPRERACEKRDWPHPRCSYRAKYHIREIGTAVVHAKRLPAGNRRYTVSRA